MNEHENRFNEKQTKYLEEGINADIPIPLDDVDGPKGLKPHYTKIHNLCLLHRFDEVSDIMKGVNPSKASVLVLMGLSRLTNIYKEDITEWYNYTRKAYDEIKLRGENADKIMRGVVHYIMTDDEIINEYETTDNDYYIRQYLMKKMNLNNDDATKEIPDFIKRTKNGS